MYQGVTIYFREWSNISRLHTFKIHSLCRFPPKISQEFSEQMRFVLFSYMARSKKAGGNKDA